MDPPPAPPANGIQRTNSMSQASESSQTAQDYIASQLSLEADAREALPYQFDTCTRPLGPLRQSVYACLTCTPPPASQHQNFAPAGVCYSCSISCHGEHNLVELFTKRDFVCDCGTTRYSNSGTTCKLRPHPETGQRGGVTGEEARQGNKYNQNFQGLFCGCGEEYDPEKEKGTMFQCLGLGNLEDGGCGEDWWHPECLLGLSRHKTEGHSRRKVNGTLETVKEEAETDTAPPLADGTISEGENPSDDPPLPAGFPSEDDFDRLICYKCVGAYPWIKQYAWSDGFLVGGHKAMVTGHNGTSVAELDAGASDTRKRKAENEAEDSQDSKKARLEESNSAEQNPIRPNIHSLSKHEKLPASPSGVVTLFLKEDFRDHFCRCPACFPRLAKHRQLLEEEESYEPPLSESDDGEGNQSVAGRSVNSGSLLDRGEAALSSMDRVRAIEGVMAYNHVRDKVKSFLQPFAESGQPVGAEDIKAYFAKLRGDEQAMRDAAGAADGGGGVEGDGRREQGGY